MLNLKNKKGYVSIEAILVAGALLVLAVATINRYREKSGGLVNSAIGEMNRVDNAYSPGERSVY